MKGLSMTDIKGETVIASNFDPIKIKQNEISYIIF